jgi:hypothetical protein
MIAEFQQLKLKIKENSQISVKDKQKHIKTCLATYEMYACEDSFEEIYQEKVSYATNEAKQAAHEACHFWPTGYDLKKMCRSNYAYMERIPSNEECLLLKREWRAECFLTVDASKLDYKKLLRAFIITLTRYHQKKLIKKFNKLSKVSGSQSQISQKDKEKVIDKCLIKFNKKTCGNTFRNYRTGEVTYATLRANRASKANCALFPANSDIKEWCQLDQEFYVPPTQEICEQVVKADW